MTITTKIEYSESDSFQKDLKRLLKKYPTLEKDLEAVKRHAIELYHLKRINSHSLFLLQNFSSEFVQFYKIKKFACKSLKSKGAKSGIRVIYAFYRQSCKVEFIEIYFKAEQASEDREKIKKYLKNIIT